MADMNQVIFNFGNFKIRGSLMSPPRRGVSSGEMKSNKLYYFQVKVESTIKMRKKGENVLQKLLDGKEVTLQYDGKDLSGVVVEVKATEVIDQWYLGLKIRLSEMVDEADENFPTQEPDEPERDEEDLEKMVVARPRLHGSGALE